MDIYFKILWGLRAVIYKIIFAQFKFPGYIGRPIFLLGTRKIHIGKHVRIFPGLRAEVHGTGLYIGDNISIGQDFHIIVSDEIKIGSGCLISGSVFVTDTDHDYMKIGVPVFEQPNIVKRTSIGKNCFIGIGVRIQAGTNLGDGCIVGANSVVRGTFPAHCMIAGIPARVIKQYNSNSGIWERV